MGLVSQSASLCDQMSCVGNGRDPQPMVGPTQVEVKPCSHLYCRDCETKSGKGSGLKITHPQTRQSDGSGWGQSHCLVHHTHWPSAVQARAGCRGEQPGSADLARLPGEI